METAGEGGTSAAQKQVLCHTGSVGHVTVGMTKGFLVSFLGHLCPVTINKVKNKLTRDLFKLLQEEFLCESNSLELISMLTITDSFLETWQQHQQLAFSPTCHELVDDSSFFFSRPTFSALPAMCSFQFIFQTA